jgi:hypothetical protein
LIGQGGKQGCYKSCERVSILIQDLAKRSYMFVDTPALGGLKTRQRFGADG